VSSYDDFANARVSMVKGYRTVRLVGHPRANRSGYVREHIAIATVALGRDLPAGAVVHHVNGIKDDNRRSNLVICPDEGYHKALHVRMRVRARGGDPWTQRICATCQQLTAASLMGKRRDKLSSECKACSAQRVRRLHERAA
jgi:hypothetical protein